MRSVRSRDLSRGQQASSIVCLAALSACLWWGWFVWDTEYVIDPATGSSSGPYELWQVAGCVVSWVVLGWLGAKVVHPALVIFIMPVSFTAAFALTVGASDESGLWGVGAILIFIGSLTGTALLMAVLNWRRPVSTVPK